MKKIKRFHMLLCGFGMNGLEWKKMKKSLLKTGSSLSSSMSFASSGCSSVMEWASTEEIESYEAHLGFHCWFMLGRTEGPDFNGFIFVNSLFHGKLSSRLENQKLVFV
ncbi:hypothetical protein NE237_024593 [Protea cynaroides]|uniref:Uncharacterized protein n=1 Tax=Protea cynaroides TaxID=273540 RepID=A0A9Q0JZR8_9MAGN|nr:hypothetical protein NE237_024593 [Protea cynaroides]